MARTAVVKGKIPPWASNHAEISRRRLGNGSTWFDPVREEALRRFEALGLPTTRREEYRFTNLAPLGRVDFRRAEGVKAPIETERIEKLLFGDRAAVELVFVNGVLDEALSSRGDLADGAVVMPLSTAIRERREGVEEHLGRHIGMETNFFAALNTAILDDGLFLHLPDRCILEKPVHVLFHTTTVDQPIAGHPRNLLIANRGSAAVVIESYAGEGETPYWTNAATEAVVGEGSRLTHYKQQLESENAFHISALDVTQSASSRFVTFSISFGASIARSDIRIDLDGEAIESDMNGLFLARGDQHVDHHTTMNHAGPRCESREFYKGILAGRAKGVFTGRIVVCKDAQKTNAFQANRNLLLSDDAAIHTQPQLEILADDVKCSHGATVGRLDEEALFYFRSRGIDPEEAEKMLIGAFAGEVVEKIDLPLLRERVAALVSARLAGGATGKETA